MLHVRKNLIFSLISIPSWFQQIPSLILMTLKSHVVQPSRKKKNKKKCSLHNENMW